MTFLKVILYPQGEGEKVDVFLHTCTISISVSSNFFSSFFTSN